MSDKKKYTKRKMLIACAEDMNEEMGLDPEIDVELEDEKLSKKIVKEAKDIRWKDDEDGDADELENDTLKTLTALGVEQPEEEEEEEEEDKPEDKDDDDDSSDDDDDDKDDSSEDDDSDDDNDDDDEDEDEPKKKKKGGDEVASKKKKTKKTKVAKKEKKTTKKKAAAPSLSCFGHRPSSMSGRIDELLAEGVTEKGVVSVLKKEFKRGKDAAVAKFRIHMDHLTNSCDVKITEKKGTFKAKAK